MSEHRVPVTKGIEETVASRAHVKGVVHPQFIREVVRQWMAIEMSDISEETTFAGWESGLEFRLWRAVQALPDPYEYCGTVIEAERIERLRNVAEWLGEWMVWRDPDGVMPVPLDVWKSELSVG